MAREYTPIPLEFLEELDKERRMSVEGRRCSEYFEAQHLEWDYALCSLPQEKA